MLMDNLIPFVFKNMKNFQLRKMHFFTASDWGSFRQINSILLYQIHLMVKKLNPINIRTLKLFTNVGANDQAFLHNQ